jgi:hypothetical protein
MYILLPSSYVTKSMCDTDKTVKLSPTPSAHHLFSSLIETRSFHSSTSIGQLLINFNPFDAHVYYYLILVRDIRLDDSVVTI